jgi:hypothetical protein
MEEPTADVLRPGTCMPDPVNFKGANSGVSACAFPQGHNSIPQPKRMRQCRTVQWLGWPISLEHRTVKRTHIRRL